jgi:serine protease Do
MMSLMKTARPLLPACCLAAALAALTAGPLAAQQPVTAAAEQVNRKMVKLYGIGGFKGLPAYGTGLLVSAKGHILTANNHILNTPDIIVHLYDGRQYHAQTVAKEPELDVALLKIDEKEKVDGLSHFDFAAAAARPLASPGDWVLAFSNQFNIATRDEPMSVQHGVLAAYTELRGRRGQFEAHFRGPVYFVDVVANNPGAAGGALTTRKGELLGIIGREYKNTLSDAWINYAVPVQAKAKIARDGKETTVDMATFVREAVAGKYKTAAVERAKVDRGGYHGIILVPNVVQVTPPYVEDVAPGSPAAKAGLRPDDLIVYIDGELVSSIKTFRDIMRGTPPGQELRLEVQRGNQLVSLALKMAEQPKQQQ